MQQAVPKCSRLSLVADPDLHIRGGGDPEIWGAPVGGAGLQKNFFGPSFGPQFHLKIRGGGPPPLDPPMLFKTGTSGTSTMCPS